MEVMEWSAGKTWKHVYMPIKCESNITDSYSKPNLRSWLLLFDPIHRTGKLMKMVWRLEMARWR